VHQLQTDVQAREQQVAELKADLEAAALNRETALKQAQAEQQVRHGPLAISKLVITAQEQHMHETRNSNIN